MFRDDFINNSNNWPIGDDTYYHLKIDDGKLVFQNKSNDNFRILWNEFPELTSGECQVSSTIKCISTQTKSYFGIIWGVTSINLFVAFFLSGNSEYYGFCKRQSGEWQNIQPLIRLPFRLDIFQKTQMNLDIDGNNGVAIVSIQGKKLEKWEYSPYHLRHNKIGFILGPSTKAEIHSLYIVDKSIMTSKNRAKPHYEEDNYLCEKPYFLSNGTMTTDYEKWHQDYHEGGYLDDDDYFIYGHHLDD